MHMIRMDMDMGMGKALSTITMRPPTSAAPSQSGWC